jgi:hypothetical protein
MGVSAAVVIPSDEFRLAQTLTENPNLRVEFERVVPFGERVAPFLWITSTDTAWVREVFEADVDVDRVEVVDQLHDGILVDVEWCDRRSDFLEVLLDAGATCLRGTGTGEAWHLTLRFAKHESLADCYRRCADRGVDMLVERVERSADSVDRDREPNLTELQRETLRTALEAGYFSVPRECTLQELADRLGVSDTAASQRIRRGLEKFLRARLA